MTSRLFKLVSINIAILFIYACSHPIEIVGQGDVTSASGNRNCYLEDFQTAKDKCTKNYAIGAYQETYYATARPGWKFDHWVNYCANATAPNYDCSFNISAAVVNQYWGQTMPPLKAVFTSCTSGTTGCGWQPGDLVTFDQGQWGTVGTTAAGILNSSFGPFYFPAPANGTLEVGIAGAGGYSIRFSNAGAVLNFLPASGIAGTLIADTSNPTTTTAGILGGEVTALAINVDFSSGGLLGGSVTTDFGNLTICGVNGVPTMTVGTFLALAENTLGGANNGYSPAAIRPVTQNLNSAFSNGTPSTFAQDHLVIGTCP